MKALVKFLLITFLFANQFYLSAQQVDSLSNAHSKALEKLIEPVKELSLPYIDTIFSVDTSTVSPDPCMYFMI